jgi:hypothetical protein
MRARAGMLVFGGLLVAASYAAAQRPGGGRGEAPAPAGGGDFATRMMAFDKDGNGSLSKEEVSDRRLHRLFDRADADRDGAVSKEELSALAAKEPANDRGGPPGFGGPGGGPGGPPRGMPRPGEVLSAMFRQGLGLTAEQTTRLDELQADVDARLEKILTDGQRTRLREMRDRGPGGFGPPGGRGRPPGAGGPPPDRPGP